MINNSEQPKKFDDALPERFLRDANFGDVHEVRITQGAGEPSPFIVKLSRDEDPVVSVTDEIAALAKSLIIDGDDEPEFSLLEEDEEGMSLDALDISAQLREFDTALPVAPEPVRGARPQAKRVYSLDEALASLVEPAVPLEALLPLARVDAVVDAHDDQFAPEASRWVFGAREEAKKIEVAPRIEERQAEPMRQRVLRFEWKVLHHASFRALAAFTALSFAIVLPLHAMQAVSGSVQEVSAIESSGRAALDDLARANAALSAQNFASAQTNFALASEKFSRAESVLNDVHAGVVALVNVIPQTNRTYSSVRGLIQAGQELTQTASIMSKAGEGLVADDSIDLVAKLDILSAYIESALPHVLAAQGAIQEVKSEVVPESYKDSVALLQAQVPAIADSMEEFLSFIDTLTYLLGGNGTQRYLVLFQNNTELRPTGGFVGSFAEVDMINGEIDRMLIPGGGTYDVQGQLSSFVASPKPISLISPRWEFQDGNWFPDFPTSAKKMQWFYEHAGGPTTDGVLAVNATFVEQILQITGAIEIPEYGVTIDAENFLFMTEKIVEVDYGTTSTPKAFLGSLVPLVLERVQEADAKTLLELLGVLERGLAERNIQVYFRDNDAERVMHELGYDGAIAQTEGDYLMVVNTNIGGGKTDAVIDQDVQVDVDISSTGTIVNTVTITKTHKGMANALFTGKNNVDYLRIYVPEGAILLSADGFEVPPDELFEVSDVPLGQDDELSLVMSGQTKDLVSGVDIWNEFGKTVFGGWMQTAPGETEIVQFTYRLPIVLFETDSDESLTAQVRRTLGFDNHDKYSLFVQKQSGVITRTTTVNVAKPDTLHTLWTNIIEGEDEAVVFQNTRDRYLGWVFAR